MSKDEIVTFITNQIKQLSGKETSHFNLDEFKYFYELLIDSSDYYKLFDFMIKTRSYNLDVGEYVVSEMPEFISESTIEILLRDLLKLLQLTIYSDTETIKIFLTKYGGVIRLDRNKYIEMIKYKIIGTIPRRNLEEFILSL